MRVLFILFVIGAIWYVAIRQIPGTGHTMLELLSIGWTPAQIALIGK